MKFWIHESFLHSFRSVSLDLLASACHPQRQHNCGFSVKEKLPQSAYETAVAKPDSEPNSAGSRSFQRPVL